METFFTIVVAAIVGLIYLTFWSKKKCRLMSLKFKEENTDKMLHFLDSQYAISFQDNIFWLLRFDKDFYRDRSYDSLQIKNFNAFDQTTSRVTSIDNVKAVGASTVNTVESTSEIVNIIMMDGNAKQLKKDTDTNHMNMALDKFINERKT